MTNTNQYAWEAITGSGGPDDPGSAGMDGLSEATEDEIKRAIAAQAEFFFSPTSAELDVERVYAAVTEYLNLRSGKACDVDAIWFSLSDDELD